MDYHEYLNSANWRILRVIVIQRCGGICERCHRWSVVNVHHLTYERFGNERPEDLLGVCSKCHEELHRERAACSRGTVS